MTEESRYKYDLLTVCLKVHMSLDSDEGDGRLSREVLAEYRDWLAMRLADWRLTDEPMSDFDRAVKALAHVAHTEANEHVELEHYPVSYSTPPMSPNDLVDLWRAKFPELVREIPVDLVVQRAERESGKAARVGLAESRVELSRWLGEMRGKR